VRLKSDCGIDLYPQAILDNRGLQITGKSLMAAFLGNPCYIMEGMEHDRHPMDHVVLSALILIKDLGDYYERVGISEIRLRECRANTQHFWHDLSPENWKNWLRKLPDSRRIRLR